MITKIIQLHNANISFEYTQVPYPSLLTKYAIWYIGNRLYRKSFCYFSSEAVFKNYGVDIFPFEASIYK